MMRRVASAHRPQRTIRATAPIRVCDNGGWTDTWFARHGKVFNIGVSPGAEVEIRAYPLGALPDRVVLDVANYRDRYAFGPSSLPGRHPLLEAVIDAVGLPHESCVEVVVRSAAPPGSSTGTSASVAVALLGGLDALTPGGMDRVAVAAAAHRIETEALGVESGVQDQLCAAFGGINFIDVSPYPEARVSQLELPDRAWNALEGQLLLVYLGAAHVSSEMHEQVITAIGRQSAHAEHVLDELRGAAEESRDAVLAADLPALGRAMRRNTDAQASLHPGLVGDDASAAIEVARASGALGWKVNGAGGEGGSITILSGDGDGPAARHELVAALLALNPRFEHLPTTLDRSGLRVW